MLPNTRFTGAPIGLEPELSDPSSDGDSSNSSDSGDSGGLPMDPLDTMPDSVEDNLPDPPDSSDSAESGDGSDSGGLSGGAGGGTGGDSDSGSSGWSGSDSGHGIIRESDGDSDDSGGSGGGSTEMNDHKFTGSLSVSDDGTTVSGTFEATDHDGYTGSVRAAVQKKDPIGLWENVTDSPFPAGGGEANGTFSFPSPSSETKIRLVAEYVETVVLDTATVGGGGSGSSGSDSTQAGSPDIEVKSIDVSPSAPEAGDSVSISVKIHNSGTASGVKEIPLRIKNAQAIESFAVSLGPDETVTKTTTIEPASGSYVYEAGSKSASVTVSDPSPGPDPVTDGGLNTGDSGGSNDSGGGAGGDSGGSDGFIDGLRDPFGTLPDSVPDNMPDLPDQPSNSGGSDSGGSGGPDRPGGSNQSDSSRSGELLAGIDRRQAAIGAAALALVYGVSQR